MAVPRAVLIFIMDISISLFLQLIYQDNTEMWLMMLNSRILNTPRYLF